jgi:hypothetical protein
VRANLACAPAGFCGAVTGVLIAVPVRKDDTVPYRNILSISFVDHVSCRTFCEVEKKVFCCKFVHSALLEVEL